MKAFVTGLALASAVVTTAAAAQDARYVQYTFYAFSPLAQFGSTQGAFYRPAQEVIVLTLDTTDLSGRVGDASQSAAYTITDGGISLSGFDGPRMNSAQLSVNFQPGTFDFDPSYSTGYSSDDFLSSSYRGYRSSYHAEFQGSGYITALFIAISNTPFPSGVGYSETGAGPAPEPASWAMMIAGFGLVGVAARRTRQTVQFAI